MARFRFALLAQGVFSVPEQRNFRIAAPSARSGSGYMWSRKWPRG